MLPSQLIHMISKWTYLSRTITDICPSLSLTDDSQRSVILLALTGGLPCSDLEYTLFALPSRLRSLRIGNHQEMLLVSFIPLYLSPPSLVIIFMLKTIEY